MRTLRAPRIDKREGGYEEGWGGGEGAGFRVQGGEECWEDEAV